MNLKLFDYADLREVTIATGMSQWEERVGVTHRGQLVELAEELVEQLDQLLRRALRRQTREAHDIRK